MSPDRLEITRRCPGSGRSLESLPEETGPRVACPGCGSTFGRVQSRSGIPHHDSPRAARTTTPPAADIATPLIRARTPEDRGVYAREREADALARRFMRSPKFKPLRGMCAVVIGGWADGTPLRWDGSGWADSDGDSIYGSCDVVLDLDDDLTRAGLLPVVRAAHGAPHFGVWCRPMNEPHVRWSCGEAGGRIWLGPTEESALLTALEAARAARGER
jgi:hypothetical protein